MMFFRQVSIPWLNPLPGTGGHYSRGPQAGGMAFFPGAREGDGVLTLGWPATYFPHPFRSKGGRFET